MTDLEELAKLYKEAHNCIEDIDHDLLEIVEEGDWIADGKYHYLDTIVKFKDQYFSIQESRSGSYHTDWYYNDSYIYPCERKEETKVVVTYPATGKPIEVPGRY